jgi:hypothetical protein
MVSVMRGVPIHESDEVSPSADLRWGDEIFSFEVTMAPTYVEISEQLRVEESAYAAS